MDGSNKLVKTAGQWQRSEVRTQRCCCCILIVPFSLIQILYKYTTQIGPPFFFFFHSLSLFFLSPPSHRSLLPRLSNSEDVMLSKKLPLLNGLFHGRGRERLITR